MANFTFKCPQCGQVLQSEEANKNTLTQCPQCRAEFVPADTQMKSCPQCGKPIRNSALKCQHCGAFVDRAAAHGAQATGKSSDLARNLIGLVVLVAFVGGLWFGWKKYQDYEAKKAAAAIAEQQEAARLELEEQKRRAAAREAAQKAEKARREAEARRRAEEKAALEKKRAEERERLEREAQARREAEKKTEELRDKKAAEERAQYNASIDRQIAALQPKLNAAKTRAKIKKTELDRAIERENQSQGILQRKGKYSSSSVKKASNAATIQREEIEKEYEKLDEAVKKIEDRISELEAQKKSE